MENDGKMKILCMVYADHNRTFEKIRRSLSQRGAHLRVLTWDRIGTGGRSSFRDGVEYYYLMHGWGFKNKKLILGRIIWIARLFFYLLRQRPDVYWAGNFECGLPAVLAACFTRVPVIYYIHDNISISYFWPGWLKSIIELLDSCTMRGSAAIIVPDENRILPYAEAHRQRIYVTPNTPNAAAAPPLREIRDRPFTVYVTGSIDIDRGIEMLLGASEHLPECRLLIAGRILSSSLLDTIKSNPRADFLGEVSHEKALDLYNECDVVFTYYDPSLPIYVRASPTKLFEAMMMSKPVIINNETMISTKVQKEDIGYLCGYNDVGGLENLLNYIAHNRFEAKSKGARARIVFETLFDWRLIEPKLWDIVMRVVDSNATKP
jgi:glycosyltransferase involved in cell wall biosynthesis